MSKDIFVYLDSSSKVREAPLKKIPSNHNNRSHKESKDNGPETLQHSSNTIPDLDRFTDVFLPFAEYFRETEDGDISEEVRQQRLAAFRAVSCLWSTRLSTARSMVHEYLTLYQRAVSAGSVSGGAPWLRRLHHAMRPRDPHASSAPHAPSAPRDTKAASSRRRSRGGGGDVRGGDSSDTSRSKGKGEVLRTRSSSDTTRSGGKGGKVRGGVTSDTSSSKGKGGEDRGRSSSETSRGGGKGGVVRGRSGSDTSRSGGGMVRGKGGSVASRKVGRDSSDAGGDRGARGAAAWAMPSRPAGLRGVNGRARLQRAAVLLARMLQRALRLPRTPHYTQHRARFLDTAARHLAIDRRDFADIWSTTNTFVKLKLCMAVRSGLLTSQLAAAHWRLLDFRVLHNDFSYNVLKWPSRESLSALETLVCVVRGAGGDWGRVARDFRRSGRECSVVMLQYIWRQLLSLSHTHTYDVLQQVDKIRKEHGLRLVETRPYVTFKEEDDDFGETDLSNLQETHKPNKKNITQLHEQVSTDDDAVFIDNDKETASRHGDSDQDSMPDLVIDELDDNPPMKNKIKVKIISKKLINTRSNSKNRQKFKKSSKKSTKIKSNAKKVNPNTKDIVNSINKMNPEKLRAKIVLESESEEELHIVTQETQTDDKTDNHETDRRSVDQVIDKLLKVARVVLTDYRYMKKSTIADCTKTSTDVTVDNETDDINCQRVTSLTGDGGGDRSVETGGGDGDGNEKNGGGNKSVAVSGGGDEYSAHTMSQSDAPCTVETMSEVTSQSTPGDELLTQPIKPWKKSVMCGAELAEVSLTRCWYRLAALLLRTHTHPARTQKKKPDELPPPPPAPAPLDPLQEWIRQKNCNQMYFNIPGVEKPQQKTKTKNHETKAIPEKNQQIKEKRTNNDSTNKSPRKHRKRKANSEHTDKQTPKLEFIIQPAAYVPLEDITPTVIITKDDQVVTTHEVGNEMELITDKCDLFLNEELNENKVITQTNDCDTVSDESTDMLIVVDDSVIALDHVTSNSDVTTQQVKQLPPLLPLIYVANQTQISAMSTLGETNSTLPVSQSLIPSLGNQASYMCGVTQHPGNMSSTGNITMGNITSNTGNTWLVGDVLVRDLFVPQSPSTQQSCNTTNNSLLKSLTVTATRTQHYSESIIHSVPSQNLQREP